MTRPFVEIAEDMEVKIPLGYTYDRKIDDLFISYKDNGKYYYNFSTRKLY
jgi:hypothetical protein